jgi:glucokinase
MAKKFAKFGIKDFKFINDFEAISYGLLTVSDDRIVQLNNKPIDESKIRGVIGPGTGLGHSVILKNDASEDNIRVLPSEGGQSDPPCIDE